MMALCEEQTEIYVLWTTSMHFCITFEAIKGHVTINVIMEKDEQYIIFFLCVLQTKVSHEGLKQHESE